MQHIRNKAIYFSFFILHFSFFTTFAAAKLVKLWISDKYLTTKF